jgi:uncharacterized protein (DUF1800 family)
MPSAADVQHLLRRTEFVARRERVAQLTSMPTLDAVVDDILAVPADPGSWSFLTASEFPRAEEYTHYWLDRMAHDSPRPFQEKMAFFWHGHFCSGFDKVQMGHPLRDQIDTFRYHGLGSLVALAKSISTGVAMLRYLDNTENRRSAPNQNFARELMELFMLGVGNYTEADVEASTRAWTGHSDDRTTGIYLWRDEWHDAVSKSFLGRTINQGGDPKQHGPETIDVMLGSGVVPPGAANVANRGRPTREVAAEFISRKMWTFFAGTTPPGAVVAAMRDSAIANNFMVKPWVRTMFLRPEFYSDDVKHGLVRSPVDFTVASLHATGLRSAPHLLLHFLNGMGQRPLTPPDVSGWKHNAAFVNASCMAERAYTARYFASRTMPGYWDGDGLIRLARGAISRVQIEGTFAAQPEQLVDVMLDLMDLTPVDSTRQALYAHVRSCEWWERHLTVGIILTMPDFHLA